MSRNAVAVSYYGTVPFAKTVTVLLVPSHDLTDKIVAAMKSDFAATFSLIRIRHAWNSLYFRLSLSVCLIAQKLFCHEYAYIDLYMAHGTLLCGSFFETFASSEYIIGPCRSNLNLPRARVRNTRLRCTCLCSLMHDRFALL